MGVVTNRYGETWKDRDGNPIKTLSDDEIVARTRRGMAPGPISTSSINTAPPQQVAIGDFDPKSIRLQQAGLFPGGAATAVTSAASKETPVQVTTGTGVQTKGPDEDWRVRVSLATGSKIFYNSDDPGIMVRLKDTQGAIFPYTPTISVTHSARYSDAKLTHSNYASHFYEGSDVSAINISGEFTVQTPDEGQYLLAVISFFRSATKMFFGNQDVQSAGSPPPMVFLNGFGKYYFPNVPCVLTSFQHTMPNDVDYVEVIQGWNTINAGGGGTVTNGGITLDKNSVYNKGPTRVPTSSTVAITLQPVYSRRAVHESFNLNKFASGELLISGASGNGGFI